VTRLTGVEQIADERRRHTEQKGYTGAHDDAHAGGEIAVAAAALAADGTGFTLTSPDGSIEESDPWGLVSKHRRNRVRQLVVAGSLIAAEIDRLQRIE
jgi:hypothetical protein